MRRGLLTIAFAAAALAASAAPAMAATPTIENDGTTSCTGDGCPATTVPNWLETQAVSIEDNSTYNSGRRMTVSLLVKHDVGRKVRYLRIDQNWDGTNDTLNTTSFYFDTLSLKATVCQ